MWPLLTTLYRYFWQAVCALLVLAVALLLSHAHTLEQTLLRERLATSQERAQTLQAAHVAQQDITTRYEEALNHERTRRKTLERTLAATRAESDRLRDTLRTAQSRIPEAPPATVSDYALAVTALLGDCQRSVTELAEMADGHANDVRTLMEAWPVE